MKNFSVGFSHLIHIKSDFKPEEEWSHRRWDLSLKQTEYTSLFKYLREGQGGECPQRGERGLAFLLSGPRFYSQEWVPPSFPASPAQSRCQVSRPVPAPSAVFASPPPSVSVLGLRDPKQSADCH